MTWILAIGVIWVACGILAYGFTLGYFQRKFRPISKLCYDNDRKFATATGILGPVGLFVSWRCAEHWKHGLMFRRPKCEQP